MRIRKIVEGSLIVGAICFSASAMAARQQVSGVPMSIMANSSSSAWQDSFDITGVTSMGSCPIDTTTGFVTADIALPGTSGTLNPSGDRLWALVLAAEVAGKKVAVLLDDSNKDATGNCVAIWITM